MIDSLAEYKEQFEIAQAAKTAIEECKRDHPEMYARFAKWFHLRPCLSDITIVTSHKDRPMRGIHVGKTTIKSAIAFLAGCINEDVVDWEKIAGKYNAKKGFQKGSRPNKEFCYQAKMINGMQNNQKLKELLGVKNLYFIGSEIIFSRDKESRHRIDIVAHDGAGKIIFFEMKAPENKKDDPVDEVKRYLEYYGKDGAQNNVFEEMMKNYPQNSIDEITEYIGYGIVGYHEKPVMEKQLLIECPLQK